MTVEELIQRATGGLKFDRHSLFRPSLVYKVLKDPFWVWCEYHAPRAEAVDETSRYDEMRFQETGGQACELQAGCGGSDDSRGV